MTLGRNGRTFSKCLENCIKTFSLIQDCGFIPKLSKCSLFLRQIMEILGMVINTVTMSVYLLQTKEKKILLLLHDTKKLKFITALNLAWVIRKLLSCTLACPRGNLYYRDLERAKLHTLKLNKWDWNSKCKLNSKCIAELDWWMTNLPNLASPIHRPNPHLSLYTDAFPYGWGSFMNRKFANGYISEKEKDLSINTKETLAIWYAFHAFIHDLCNKHVLIQSDNTMAISYVCRMGGMKSDLRTKIARDLWNFAVEINSWISISHIPRTLNSASDMASRIMNPHSKWCLLPSVFCAVCTHFRLHPKKDLFASQLNKQISHFYSYAPDPFCSHVDALTTNWSDDCT